MRKDVVRSFVVVVATTVVLGLVYPAVMVGFASVAFHGNAEGSLISRNGVVVGSKLAAQGFTSPRYFHERPSGTSPAYDAGATTFLNLGPTNPDLAKLVHDDAHAVLALERPYNPGLTIRQIPVDAVTTSGSGIDPEISPAYAQLQARRVAAVRHLPLATVEEQIRRSTVDRSWGFFGEPGVNVLELNLALDELEAK
jgi:potassium-transporting ATPase KdpC subunit